MRSSAKPRQLLEACSPGSLQCVAFLVAWRYCYAPGRPSLRSGKVELGSQLSGESRGTLGRGSWSAHREGGVPIWLFMWSRRGSDRDILNIVPFGMLPKFAQYQGPQLRGAFLFLHAFLSVIMSGSDISAGPQRQDQMRRASTRAGAAPAGQSHLTYPG